MKVIFSPRARDELREIQIYIAFDNVAAAARVASRIRGERAAALAPFLRPYARTSVA